MAIVRSRPLPDTVGNFGAPGRGQCHDHARMRTITGKTGEKSMERLKGKVAMVVGAGSIGPGWGNGKATAVTFAREGAQVFCVDRNAAAAEETVKIIAGEGGKAAAFTADVSRGSEVEGMVAACLKTYGRI